ncbi:MAG: hypothetical protein RKH07_01510 [Gammaproteobacteria bacterium]
MKTLRLITTVILLTAPTGFAADAQNGWRSVVRATPYWESKGVAANLTTVRHWVLFSESYCANPDRHLLLDYRWRFLGYIDDGATAAETNDRLNTTRQRLAEEGRIQDWHAGGQETLGYPFAISCDQPFVQMHEAIARLTGDAEGSRIWGSWDGIDVGAENAQVSLLQLFHEVVDHRREQGRFTFPDTTIPTFLGKVLIESSVIKEAESATGALGIMQLSRQVLNDCRIPERFYLHRIVQVDCALNLVEQNHRNLRPRFNDRFGHLPTDKQDRLYGLLLTQTYLIGVGRSIELLQDEELGAAARYFAANHDDFSAEDIMTGLIYHNLGRKDLGLLSLYYVIDAGLAQAALCAIGTMADDAWCSL